jgi:hypothetical protein
MQPTQYRYPLKKPIAIFFDLILAEKVANFTLEVLEIICYNTNTEGINK